MKVTCAICDWEGLIKELTTVIEEMDEIGPVDECPICGASNVDQPTASLIYTEGEI